MGGMSGESEKPNRPQFTLAAVGVFVGILCIDLALWRWAVTIEIPGNNIGVLAVCVLGTSVGFTVGYLQRIWKGAFLGVLLGIAVVGIILVFFMWDFLAGLF